MRWTVCALDGYRFAEKVYVLKIRAGRHDYRIPIVGSIDSSLDRRLVAGDVDDGASENVDVCRRSNRQS